MQRLYIGNAHCGLLFPEDQRLKRLMDKADYENVAISFVTADLRSYPLEQMAEYGGEIIVNDWGMLRRVQAFRPGLQPVFGNRLNRRRKDPRMRFKRGYEQQKALLSENALNEALYRDFLKALGVERYEYESSGTPVNPPETPCSLYLPFYQTNDSAYCPLRAYIEASDRGCQTHADSCPKYCAKNAFFYPGNLKLVGRYSALLALNDDYANILPSGFDRIVLNF